MVETMNPNPSTTVSKLEPAVSVSLLLSDWCRYSLTDRSWYHFCLTNALIGSEEQTRQLSEHKQNSNDQKYENDPKHSALESSYTYGPKRSTTPRAHSPEEVCGVHSILECVPNKQLQLSSRQKRDVKNSIRKFNDHALSIRAEKNVFCHEPERLPLPINTHTRLFFAYEFNRIAFCLDASPSLTATFGFSCSSYGTNMSDMACCPMDRLADMARVFFDSLIQPISVPGSTNTTLWQPVFAVTVLAVYPKAAGGIPTNILVRDFRVYDRDSSAILATKIKKWALGSVEVEIAKRLSQRNPDKNQNTCGSFLTSHDSGLIPFYTSSLEDLLTAGNAALTSLSSEARPYIVVATDCHSVECRNMIDIVTETDLLDTPLIVLDLSMSSSDDALNRNIHQTGFSKQKSEFTALNYDPVGSMYPLHFSDDSEALYNACVATGGCFFDSYLLREASNTKAGSVEENSVLSRDQFFTFKRHVIKPNAVQWYILFSLSPLTETKLSSTLGKLVPPRHVRNRLPMNGNPDVARKTSFGFIDGTSSAGLDNRPNSQVNSSIIKAHTTTSKACTQQTWSRTLFATYIINPIPIHGILMMRIKEGFITKQYGQSTNDPKRVSIHMILRLDLGLQIHYEVLYSALPNELWVGDAHIKVDLSGDPNVIAILKDQFKQVRAVEEDGLIDKAISNRICNFLRLIKEEDLMQSYLSPLKWSDQLTSPQTPFIRRLRSLNATQRSRHFRSSEFDCVCIGRLPWTHAEDFLHEFRSDDNGEQALTESIATWSAQSVEESRRFIKPTGSIGGLAGYCVIYLKRYEVATRLITVVVETQSGHTAGDRHSLLNFLKGFLCQIKGIIVVEKQLGPFVIPQRISNQNSLFDRNHHIFRSQLNHTSWELFQDTELLPLLMKRRSEISNFLLLVSTKESTIFAKLTHKHNNANTMFSDPGDFVQYQISVLDDKLVVDVYMESEGGVFYPFLRSRAKPTIKPSNELNYVNSSNFAWMTTILRKRDQECSQALRCRTTLLQVFNDDVSSQPNDETYQLCIEKLLPYTSKTSLRLRFYGGDNHSANSILLSFTEEMLLSQAFHAKVAKLPIASESSIGDLGKGFWFVIEFDKQTISVVLVSSLEYQEGAEDDATRLTYRELSFFTFGISDLYDTRDDIVDDDSDGGHISEYMCVTKFHDSLSQAHRYNYSAAAYLALKGSALSSTYYFSDNDLEDIMKPLSFCEVARVNIEGEANIGDTDESKLLKMIGLILHPLNNSTFYYVPAASDKNFFSSGSPDEDGDISGCDSSTNELFTHASEDDLDIHSGDASDDCLHYREEREDNDSLQSVNSSSKKYRLVVPPVFVTFLQDDKPIEINNLGRTTKSSSLSVLISIFKDKLYNSHANKDRNHPDFPLSHYSVGNEISYLLNAYVAEETLERLRRRGSQIWGETSNLRLAKSCLRKSSNLVSSSIDVIFYYGEYDKVFQASSSIWPISELNECYNLLHSELLSCEDILLRPCDAFDVFFVDTCNDESELLRFWCLINIQRAQGALAVKIYHPSGSVAASEAMHSIINAVASSAHRVNQLLLLRKLHQSKSASTLLIPPDPGFASEDEESGFSDEIMFQEGSFSCPVVYRTSFDLFHRCATNPLQVARSLASSVLQNFAVSNRMQLFVYKDEKGSIFYMGLSTSGGGLDADGRVELLVYGLHTPGPSITSQLRRLLQKRLLYIAVDLLSAVLTKNPHYSWKHADIDFIRAFDEKWKILEIDSEVDDWHSERVYLFPTSAYDPCMILLYFRQNICGSTFFHRLVTSEWTETEKSDESPCENATVCLSPTDLLFYYNNSPSKLDPKFQSQSTLTGEGAKFASLAGSGIAIVEVTLLDGQGRIMRELNSANKPFKSERVLDAPEENFTFKERSEIDHSFVNQRKDIFVKVKVTDTALKCDALHKWIHLTLNQVLVAWNVERIMERRQRGLFLPYPKSLLVKQNNIDLMKKLVFEEISCGLPAITSCFLFGEKLPHPAIHRMDHVGTVRASSVATLALGLLDHEVFDYLKAETKNKISFDPTSYDIIRSSRSTKPRRVHLSWDDKRLKAVVRDSSGIINDSPIDCPEYIVFYFYPEYEEVRRNSEPSPPKLFEEVAVGGDRNVEIGDSKSLHALKDRNFFACRRTFAFILSVKRNRRMLLTYNWNISLFKNFTSRFTEHCSSSLANGELFVNQVQMTSLKVLAPSSEVQKTKPTKVAMKQNTLPQSNSFTNMSDISSLHESSATGTNQVLQPRRIPMPFTIRKPTLVGKSVEGAAIHAAAASRARASASRFKGNIQSTNPSSQPKGSIEERKGHRERMVTPPAVTSLALVPERKSEERNEDVDKNDAKKLYFAIIHEYTTLRPCTVRSSLLQLLVSTFWPVHPTKISTTSTISHATAQFLLSRSHLAFSDVSEILPLPKQLLTSFLQSFSNSLSRVIDVHFVSLSNQSQSVILMGKVRKVQRIKCFVVIQISMKSVQIDKKMKILAFLEARVLTVRRKYPTKPGMLNLFSNKTLEKDATAFDVLAVHLRNTLREFDAILFDHVCTVMERSMKSINGDLSYREVVTIHEELLTRYPLRKMMLLQSNYKCYEATIVLQSYQDDAINQFDGPTLYRYLASDTKKQNLVPCGPNALCFKREIIMNGTNSICFLKYSTKTPDRMQLALLCRTHGQHLYEYIFRPGSAVAMTVLDVIAVEGAGLAYKVLHNAATMLLLLLQSSEKPVENLITK